MDDIQEHCEAGWLGLDIICASVPFIPAAGIVRHAGKIDDVIDLVKGADKVESAVDAGKVADKAADAVKAVDDITVGPNGGTSWSTVRRNYWKTEVSNNPGHFDAVNLKRTKRGLSPQRKNLKTGKMESKQLHHKKPRSQGGGHERSNLVEVWPDEHKNLHY